MKVTKLKKGYRINLSDSEMRLLREINSEGIQAYVELGNESNGLAPSEKRILTEIGTMKREWL